MILSKVSALLMALFMALFVGFMPGNADTEATPVDVQNDAAATKEVKREITILNNGVVDEDAVVEEEGEVVEVVDQEDAQADLVVTEIIEDAPADRPAATNETVASAPVAQDAGAEIIEVIVEDVPASSNYTPQHAPAGSLGSAHQEAVAWQIIELTNAYRIANGVHPLQGSIGGNTKAHADWMAANEVLQHTSDTTVGENVALAYTDKLDAAEVMGRWKASPGHDRNLLDPRYHTIEVWCSHGSTGYSYCAQQFRF